MLPHRHAYRPVVLGRRGVVTSAHPLASAAGAQILLEGGNAVDAAVATAAALTVVEPYMSGAGGVGVMVVSSARTGQRHVLNFVGRVPQAADPDRATPDDLAGGPRACLVPGNLGGWLAAHERFGRAGRETVFEPAIRLAEDGFPLTRKNCEFIERARATLGRSTEAQRLYVPVGLPKLGQVLVQKDLAASYRQVAEGGADVFYRGPIGRAVCRAVQEAGGWLCEDDLAAFTPEWMAPLATPFRGAEVITVPPPFVAFQALQTLNILEEMDLAGWGHNSAEYLHHVVEAVKLANADRLAYAWVSEVPIAGLLSKAYARAQRARIDPARAGVSEGERFDPQRLPGQIEPGRPTEFAREAPETAHPPDFTREHTTHFAVADAEGTVVTVTQTLGAPFGSGFAVPGTGIVLNNLLQWQDLDPASPNRMRPGRRVGTNMAPMQVFRDGECVMSMGTPGSYGILQTTPQMLLAALVFGMDVQEAIEAPRVRVYRDRLVDVEGRIASAICDDLSRRGHQVNVIEDWSWVVGGGQGIVRDPDSGVLQGGADPRRDGYAIAL
ncbi:MAG: gamma-glutamyltransferase [Armatimonadota bacterium]|nr:gamma-glutamyltransferase [Armatimonadota bacterium]